MKTIVEIILPDGTKQRLRVPTSVANSKAGKRAFSSGHIGGTPSLSHADIRAFDATRQTRANILKSRVKSAQK